MSDWLAAKSQKFGGRNAHTLASKFAYACIIVHFQLDVCIHLRKLPTTGKKTRLELVKKQNY
jgi:hypothetical protein